MVPVEGVDEKGGRIIGKGYAGHGEDVSVVEVEEVCTFPVEGDHLLVRGALRHRLDQHLLILLRPISLDPSAEHPAEGALVRHGRKADPLSLHLTETP